MLCKDNVLIITNCSEKLNMFGFFESDASNHAYNVIVKSPSNEDGDGARRQQHTSD